jgi:hypothetical protein
MSADMLLGGQMEWNGSLSNGKGAIEKWQAKTLPILLDDRYTTDVRRTVNN